MPQVVGYKGFETMENYNTVSSKLVVVVYENSNYKALFEKIVVFWVCALVWKLVLWSFECMIKSKQTTFLQRNPDMTIIVEYVKQDSDIGHFTGSLETGPVFSRIELWDCLGDEDRPRLLRNLLMAHFGKE